VEYKKVNLLFIQVLPNAVLSKIGRTVTDASVAKRSIKIWSA